MDVEKLLVYTEHRNGFSPVCVRVWLVRSVFWEKLLPHTCFSGVGELVSVQIAFSVEAHVAHFADCSGHA